MPDDRVLATYTRDHLKKVVGGRDGRYPWLETLTWDIASWEDDFMGDTLHGSYQSTAVESGAAQAAISAGVENGVVLLNAASADNGSSDLSLGLHWSAELSCGMAVRLKLNNAATVKCEVGFTDVVSGTDAGVVNVLATPTVRAADAVVWAADTDDTAYWQALGVDSGTITTKIEPSLAIDATYNTFMVQLQRYDSSSNIAAAQFRRADANGHVTYTSDWMTAAVTSNVLLTPWVYVQNRTTSNRTCTIDFIHVWQRRTIT